MSRADADAARDAAPALALEGIHKRYGSLTALADVSLRVRRGAVHALLGENGAGKTTLMHVAYGLLRADAGRVHVQGRATPIRHPADAIAAGIGMVHQHFTLVPTMTVAENLALGGRGRLALDLVAERVRRVGADTGFALDPDARVETLSVGAQQRVEIAKALIRDARVLILDEPTAVLAPAETAELLRWLRAYVAGGNAAVIITHKLREALDVADDVTVLRRGRVVHVASAATMTTRSLGAAMMGESAEEAEGTSLDDGLSEPRPHAGGAVAFRAERLTIIDRAGVVRVRDATFVVRTGEIVGVAGVEGSGQHELLRALAGRMRPSAGTLDHPASIGFVPEDRHHDAVLLARTLTENVALRDAGRRRGVIDWRAMRRDTDALLRAFDVRTTGPQARMSSLSGGNQQKLVLARELGLSPGEEMPRAIVAENPTRGLDVRASADVHARLRAARTGGAAIVLYSSDLDEVLALATRVLVAHAGTVRELPPDRGLVGRAMLGDA